jgi:hypothetical protein
MKTSGTPCGQGEESGTTGWLHGTGWLAFQLLVRSPMSRRAVPNAMKQPYQTALPALPGSSIHIVPLPPGRIAVRLANWPEAYVSASRCESPRDEST